MADAALAQLQVRRASGVLPLRDSRSTALLADVLCRSSPIARRLSLAASHDCGLHSLRHVFSAVFCIRACRHQMRRRRSSGST